MLFYPESSDLTGDISKNHFLISCYTDLFLSNAKLNAHYRMPLSEAQLVGTSEVTCMAHEDNGPGFWKYSESSPWKLTPQHYSPAAQRGIRDLIRGFWRHMVSWYDATQHITVGLHRCQTTVRVNSVYRFTFILSLFSSFELQYLEKVKIC